MTQKFISGRINTRGSPTVPVRIDASLRLKREIPDEVLNAAQRSAAGSRRGASAPDSVHNSRPIGLRCDEKTLHKPTKSGRNPPHRATLRCKRFGFVYFCRQVASAPDSVHNSRSIELKCEKRHFTTRRNREKTPRRHFSAALQRFGVKINLNVKLKVNAPETLKKNSLCKKNSPTVPVRIDACLRLKREIPDEVLNAAQRSAAGSRRGASAPDSVHNSRPIGLRCDEKTLHKPTKSGRNPPHRATLRCKRFGFVYFCRQVASAPDSVHNSRSIELKCEKRHFTTRRNREKTPRRHFSAALQRFGVKINLNVKLKVNAPETLKKNSLCKKK
ncbi:hypothetical protein F2P81_012167 [Scophthalmus maximus]|uniref:Uncharacterized protein n=1 Tax=Scophthalmus maximus TaxID=52904 RepID=A0A6A4SNY3_SCOMX|nr:hypothetical protein F2P81_012167 [Scophthalmus maximus]